MGMRNRTEKRDSRFGGPRVAPQPLTGSSEWVHCSNDAITFVSDTTAGRRA